MTYSESPASKGSTTMGSVVSPRTARLGTGVGAYGRLLRHGPASRPFGCAALARLTLAMIPLGIVILVEHERHSYALAGVVSGAYAIGAAVGTPIWGRLMDRFGQIPVLLPTSLASAALLAALALAIPGDTPAHVLVGLAVGVGLSYPAISPALRSSFRIVLPDPEDRRVAFALDATSVELAFVCGPLFLSALLLPEIPVLPLLVTAGLLAGGGVGYCATDVARRATAEGQRLASGHGGEPTGSAARSALASTGVLAVLAVMVMVSVGFGQLDTSMAATADRALGGTAQVGLLFAAIAGGSTLGGLAYGARTWPFDERRAVPVLLSGFALFLGLLAALLALDVVNLLVLMPVLFVTGLTIAPTLIMQQSLLDRSAPPHRLNEAQALLSASNTTGAAIGTAIAGIVIDGAGISWSFAGASACVLVAAGVALLNRSGSKPADHAAAPTCSGSGRWGRRSSGRALA